MPATFTVSDDGSFLISSVIGQHTAGSIFAISMISSRMSPGCAQHRLWCIGVLRILLEL